MTTYLLRRLLALLPVILVVVTIVFFLIHLIPGDPVAVILGPEANAEQIEAAGLVDWRSFGHSLQSRFRTGNFVTGLRLVNLIGEAAEEAGHHPDLDLRYPLLNVRLYSHDAFGITDRDVALARRISELAAGLGVPADPSTVSVVEIALEVVRAASVAGERLLALPLGHGLGVGREIRRADLRLVRPAFRARRLKRVGKLLRRGCRRETRGSATDHEHVDGRRMRHAGMLPDSAPSIYGRD